MARRRGRTGAIATVLMVGIVVLLLVAWMILFRVEFTEYVLVQTFGKTTRVLDGRKDAGLHVKWPFIIERAVRYDARTFVFDDTMNELSTKDTQSITLTTFCAWRIADPVRFQESIGTVEAAQEGIRSKLRAAKQGVVGDRRMEDLVNTSPQRMRLVEIENAIAALVRKEAADDYGVEVVTVGVKSLGLPESVSKIVIEAMKEERQKEADTYKSAGEAEALAIRERAREASEQILAFASRKAGEIRAQGERAAATWYKEFEKDWQFAAFLRSVESLKKELTGRSVFLLDGSVIPAVNFFRQGPSLPTTAPAAKVRPATQPAGR